jgi:MarR family transcriptional regulator for hemolysin
MSGAIGGPAVLGAIEGSVVNALLQAARRVSDCVGREVAPEGLSQSAVRALELLLDAGGRGLSQSDLAARLAVSAASITRLVDDLALRQLVERQPHVHDRRTKMIQLTDGGRTVLRSTRERLARVETSLMARHDALTLHQVVEALNQISARR